MHYLKTLREYHIVYGLHSNIPLCCILWWMDEEGRDTGDMKRGLHKKVGYVPCPTCCEKETFVKIHTCEGKCENLYKELANICLELKK